MFEGKREAIEARKKSDFEHLDNRFCGNNARTGQTIKRGHNCGWGSWAEAELGQLGWCGWAGAARVQLWLGQGLGQIGWKGLKQINRQAAAVGRGLWQLGWGCRGWAAGLGFSS